VTFGAQRALMLQHIKTLQRRRLRLTARIGAYAALDIDVARDRAEADALEWACAVLEDILKRQP
jgi:hypothetical protein